MGVWGSELDLDLASHRQIGRRKKTNPAFTEVDTTAVDDRGFSRVIDHDTHRGVKRITLPAAPM